MSSLQKKVLTAKIPRGLPPRPLSLGRGRGGARGGRGDARVFTPLHWSKYFRQNKEFKIGTSTFNVYIGTYYISLQSRILTFQKSTSFIGGEEDEGPLIVFLHGGGYSGLTWAALNLELTNLVKCQTLAPDLRGHGCSSTEDDYNLSADTMAEDISKIVIEHIKSFENTEPEVILVGHSMGGALAVHTALQGEIDNLVGIVVVDVVEGTAMDALSSMQNVLRGRPKCFPSIDYAIEWSLKSGQVRKNESARISMPGQLIHKSSNKCAALEVQEAAETAAAINDPEKVKLQSEDTITEEDETEEEPKFKDPKIADEKPYLWRIDLGKTEPHWTGWFSNLSSKFLSVPASKMLILAGVDRLDRELTVGQMQGKFQMQVLPQAGHAVHEDVPEKMAEVVAFFLTRNKFAEAKDNFQPVFPGC